MMQIFLDEKDEEMDFFSSDIDNPDSENIKLDDDDQEDLCFKGPD